MTKNLSDAIKKLFLDAAREKEIERAKSYLDDLKNCEIPEKYILLAIEKLANKIMEFNDFPMLPKIKFEAMMFAQKEINEFTKKQLEHQDKLFFKELAKLPAKKEYNIKDTSKILKAFPEQNKPKMTEKEFNERRQFLLEQAKGL